MTAKVRVAVIGASGYTGGELLRILASHPHVELTGVTAERHAGKLVQDVFPSLHGAVGRMPLEKLTADEVAARADVAFTALPHHTAANVVADLLAVGVRVVDLSADYRFENVSVYEAWYGEHPRHDVIADAVYGLPELHRDRIRGARLVGNPGCYVNSIILGLAPFLRNQLIETTDILVDAKSGVTGAGRAASEALLFAEVNGGLRPYKVADHRHQPEVEKELALVAGGEVRITFVPHLLPISRGILSTMYCRRSRGFSLEEAHAVLEEFYREEPFVRVLPLGSFANPAHIKGSNYCDVAVHMDERQNRLIVFSALDNLGKGAAGQAVQNMNLMMELPETTGLDTYPVFP